MNCLWQLWEWIRHTPDWGTVPQWFTASIAGGALIAAAISIRSQREIARKRAATDFFLKTEMDGFTLESHKEYTEAVKLLKGAITNGKMSPDFAGTAAYSDIRDYLNLHELMAVGLLNEVFDDNVCFDFWSQELNRAHEDTLPLIDYVQSLPHGKNTYTELIKVAKRWSARPDAY
jgi:hypothetical protein